MNFIYLLQTEHFIDMEIFWAIRHRLLFVREEDFPTSKLGELGEPSLLLLCWRGCNVILSRILPISPPPLSNYCTVPNVNLWPPIETAFYSNTLTTYFLQEREGELLIFPLSPRD